MTEKKSQETFYFGAGPAVLPKPVLGIIKNDVVDYRGTGLSVLELSHRSDEFIEILDQAEYLLRELMDIPEDYAVMFMHGGATAQYSMLPLNFLSEQDVADYICTGHWSNKACQEAKKYADINVVQALIESEDISIKPIEQWVFSQNSKYVHYCDNETINGVACDLAAHLAAKVKSNKANLFCDMTSSILTRPIEVKDYGLIYASAQKNLGIAGLCVLVMKKEILDETAGNVPSIFSYKTCFENRSLTNTPPTFAIYALTLMLRWLKEEGGVEKISNKGQMQAKTLYDLIDASEIYKNKVNLKNRSNINVPFVIEYESLQTEFLQHAEKHGLLGLRGHKSVGGIRASLYNAMPQQGVTTLVEFMRDFELNHVG
jgi:phosphoserine aminotransferase